MNQRLDDDMEESLKELNRNIRLKPEYETQLRDRVLKKQPHLKTSSNKKIWLSVAAVLLLFLGSSPFYSTTMASLVEKFIPLEIKTDDASNNYESLLAIIKDAGYEVSSIGSKPNPYQIEISLMEGEESLSAMKEVLVPKIKIHLNEQGIDDYQLNITLAEQIEVLPQGHRELNETMERAGSIISEAYTRFGYTDLAKSMTFGISGEASSRILEIDLPDHIKESEEIVSSIKSAIKEENLDIKKVEIRYYNEKHRNQDNRWGSIVGDVYQSLAGKSTYKVNGISYKVKDGVTNVWIKSTLPENMDTQVISNIEIALREYLSSEELSSKIQNDQYEIELLSKSKKVLLQVSNVPK